MADLARWYGQTMRKSFLISLAEQDLGQILDGLEVRKNAWRDTADFLESGNAPDESFIMEDCSDPEEARNLERRYEQIMSRILKQRDAQMAWDRQEPRAESSTGRRGFCIFVDSMAEGHVPLDRDEFDKPVIYSTRNEAEYELADLFMERMHEFLRGERDFESALPGSEYVTEVRVHTDGTVEPI